MTGSIPFINLPLQYTNLKAETLEAIDRVLSSGVLLDGLEKKALKSNLKTITNYKHVVLTHSGTIAIQIIARYYKALSQERRPIVSIPAVSFAASANAFHNEGFGVKFTDVDEYGMSLQPEIMSTVFMPVGLYGNPADVDRYDSKHMTVFEDGCQSWTGNQSFKTTVVSFDPMKNISSIGNGGAILTDDAKLAEYAEKYCNHGKHQGVFYTSGSNLRMSEVECAVLNIKLKYLPAWQHRRRQIAEYFMNEIRDTKHKTLVDETNIEGHGLQKFVLRTEKRDEMIAFLQERGIETKIHYEKPLPLLPQYKNCLAPKTNYYATFCKSVLSLPFYPELTDTEVEYIAKTVKES